MSQTPILYQSTDASAPQLAGTAGALLTVLHAILVTGYGSKAALGWTREHNGTNVSVYRNNAVRGTGNVVRIDDSGSGAGGAREALLRIGRSATDVNTLVEPSPSAAQLASGVVWPKSTAVSATTRPWRAVGTERWLYLFVDTNSDGVFVPFFVGDILSFAAGDARAFAVFGSEVQTHTTTSYGSQLFDAAAMNTAPASVTQVGGWLLSNYANVPGGVRAQCVQVFAGQTIIGSTAAGLPAYPHLVNGGALFRRIELYEPNAAAGLARGVLPNAYAAVHARPFADLSTLPNVLRWPGDTSPAALLAANFRCAGRNFAGNDGQFCIDMTNATH